jgi:hypothetical protein
MLIFDAIEQFDGDRIILRVEDLESESILRITIDSEKITELVEKNEVTIIEEYDISYDEDDENEEQDYYDRY